MGGLKGFLLKRLIKILLKSLGPQISKEGLDVLLDWLEAKVIETDNDVDDMVVLPIIEMIRESFDIPDND